MHRKVFVKIHQCISTILNTISLSLSLYLFLNPKVKELLIKARNFSEICITEFWLILYIICFGVRQTWAQLLVPSFPDYIMWASIISYFTNEKSEVTVLLNRVVVMIKEGNAHNALRTMPSIW